MTRLLHNIQRMAGYESVPASATVSCGMLDLHNIRTATISVRITYAGGAGTAATLQLLYSPDGRNFDTVVYTSLAITLTAGATVQRTAILDLPEQGYMEIRVANGDAVNTNLQVWYSVARHGDTHIEADKMIFLLGEIERKMLDIDKLRALQSLTA